MMESEKLDGMIAFFVNGKSLIFGRIALIIYSVV